VAKTIAIPIVDDAYPEGEETFAVRLSNVLGAIPGSQTSATVRINDSGPAGNSNPSDEARFFVRQHYLDFLNREPDADGLAFWANQITSCGTDAQCLAVKRINVSAAFFLSIEFQDTGYFAYRTYKAAFGDTTSPNVGASVPRMRFQEFLQDAQFIGHGVQVGSEGWQAQLANNQAAFARAFVERPAFLAAYPLGLTPAQFVDKLDQNAGRVLTPAERDQLVNELTVASDLAAGRASVLLKVTENSALRRNESNRAFVLMQYYGYLRRNPDDPQDTDFRGWEFWLNKLNQFNGNFAEAEMVKAFLGSGEYRKLFGP